MYLELMKLTLTDLIYTKESRLRGKRYRGKDWPERAYTMIGMKRLDNIQDAVTDVIEKGVPGDLVECGVWRGGACIFMKALLKVLSDTERCVWLADSFKGLPPPKTKIYPADKGQTLHKYAELAVSRSEVIDNFNAFGLLDSKIHFLEGWFEDTLPTAPIDSIAVLRLDGDYYQSTIEILTYLYDKVSPGGWVIVDDYYNIEACYKAVHDFRNVKNCKEPIQKIDWSSVYWIKE
jgi:hypothetical protein